jgi:hypothetical protein
MTAGRMNQIRESLAEMMQKPMLPGRSELDEEQHLEYALPSTIMMLPGFEFRGQTDNILSH